MDIAVLGLENFPKNKVKIPDERLKVLKRIFKSKEIVPASVFFLPRERINTCEGIIASRDALFDLIVDDMDFIDRKLREETEDKPLLEKAMSCLEEEKPLYEAIKSGDISEDESKRLREYPIYSLLPYIALQDPANAMDGLPELWWSVFGRGIFFTAGEKDSHAWMFRIGQTAVECAGIIHTDIARGFVRAEIAKYKDIVELGSLSAVRQRGLLKLEGKEYIMEEGDWALFRSTC